VKPTFWLTSYPKSGNTWLRILLANLCTPRDRPADINDIESTDSIASARQPFDALMMIESGVLLADEITALRPRLYSYLAEIDDTDADTVPGQLDRLPARFVKTHDAYGLTPGGEPMMGGSSAAAGAILIVRDPRDVAVSFAHHLSRNVDSVVARMADPRFALAAGSARCSHQFPQLLTDWSGFNRSWLDQRDVPVLLVRYEDLAAATAETLQRVLAFANCPTDCDAVRRAVAKSALPELQRQERARGFREAPPQCSAFFRRGLVGGWKDSLTQAQARRIEVEHQAMMERLGYGPSGESEVKQ